MRFEFWLGQQVDRNDLIGEMARSYTDKATGNISSNFSLKSTRGDVKMEASVNQYCAADALLSRDKCIDVGLESIASAQRAGYSAEGTAQRGFQHADGTAQRMAIAELDATRAVGSDVCDSSRDIMRDLHGVDNHVSSSVERMGLYNAGVTERFGLSELEAIHASEKYLFAGMSENVKDILLKSCADTASIKDQSANQFKDILLQNAENAKDAAVTACTNVKDLIILGDKHYAQIQIEALRNKEDLARQIAECCCENKALLLETSHQTQDVIRKLDEQRVRDELARTREELIALRVRATLTPPLTGAIPL